MRSANLDCLGIRTRTSGTKGMDYQHFTTVDFVSDASFQKWVIAPDPATQTFWEAWLRHHPHKTAEVEEARQLIQTLGFGTNYEANRAMIEVWQNIQRERFSETIPDPVVEKPSSVFSPAFTFRAAAALSAVILLTYVLFRFFQPAPTTTFATRYGETKTVILPDSSVVVLNANTQLSFPSHWNTSKPREVWLKGEAFFRVREKKETAQAKFRVHAREVMVEVLGTHFNVNNRRNRSQVVLASGKIRLMIPQRSAQKSILMKPGDRVDVAEKGAIITHTIVDPARYASWQNNQLIFDKTSLREIAALLEDTYGYTIVFAESQLADKKFSGNVPARQPDLLLTALSKLYDLAIIRRGNHFTITPKNR